MYTTFQVILVSEDGEYPQQDFQTYEAACEYCASNQPECDEGQELQVKPIYRSF